MESVRGVFFVAHLEQIKFEVPCSVRFWGVYPQHHWCFVHMGLGIWLFCKLLAVSFPATLETTACGKLFRKQSYIP